MLDAGFLLHVPAPAFELCTALVIPYLYVGDQHFSENVGKGAVLGLTADVKISLLQDVRWVGPVLVTLGL